MSHVCPPSSGDSQTKPNDIDWKQAGCGFCILITIALILIRSCSTSSEEPQAVASDVTTSEEANPLTALCTDASIITPDFTILSSEERNGKLYTEVEIQSYPESTEALLKIGAIVSTRTTYNGPLYVCFRSKELPSAGYVYGKIIFEKAQKGLQLKSNETMLPNTEVYDQLRTGEKETDKITPKRKKLEAAIETLFKQNPREGVYISYLAVSHIEAENFSVSFNISAPASSYSNLGVDEIKRLLNTQLPYPVTECIITAVDLSGTRVIRYQADHGIFRIEHGRTTPVE